LAAETIEQYLADLERILKSLRAGGSTRKGDLGYAD
jgi:hypothetical protein